MAILISIAVLCLVTPAFIDGALTYGPPICSKNSQTNKLTTTFTLKATSGQTVGDIFGLVLNNNGELVKVSDCNSTSRVVVENGMNVTVYEVESTVNLANESDTINGCGITKVLENSKEAYRVIIGIRETQFFIMGNDTNYRWSCIRDEATDLYLSTNVDVISDNLTVIATVAKPNVTLQVMRQINNVWTATSTCTVGEPIRLGVMYDRPLPYTDFLTPWGVFIFNTKMGQTASTTNEVITMSNGCLDTNNRLGFTQAFVRTSNSPQPSTMYQATGGKCKRFGNTNKMYFETTVEFCSGVSDSEPKCISSCQTSGRKRRQAKTQLDLNPQRIVIELNIIEDKSEEDSFKMLLVAMMVVVVVILALVLLIGVCLFLRSRNRRRSRSSSKTRFTNSSKASSDSSLPPKY